MNTETDVQISTFKFLCCVLCISVGRVAILGPINTVAVNKQCMNITGS